MQSMLDGTVADGAPARGVATTPGVNGAAARHILEAGRRRMRQISGNAREPQSARRIVSEVLRHYWEALRCANGSHWELPSGVEAFAAPSLAEPVAYLARQMGRVAASLSPIEAGYRIGCTYTDLLPKPYQGKLGIYYTPPALARRLLDDATEAGVEWRTCTVLDPACGGAAFLAPVALRMVAAMEGEEASGVLDSIARRLRGYEVDPFGAWMAQVLVEAALMDLSSQAGRRLPGVVEERDSLAVGHEYAAFDLVVGNPPYGRARLSPDRRRRYERSLFGHANTYGLFYDLALRLTRPGGVIAFLTPTSFLSGEYFKALRNLLGHEAQPVVMDFIDARKDVFEGVLQEALLATYRKGPPCGAEAPVNVVAMEGGGGLRVDAAGTFTYPGYPAAPWILPRSADQADLVRRMRGMSHRLADYGYEISTGPLVWNRHKDQLRSEPGPGCLPLLWAEVVAPEGRFIFRSEKRNHEPFFAVEDGQEWLVTREPCVLLQRTTAKEQHRRLIAAELPSWFLDDYGAAIVENHLNLVKPVCDDLRVAPIVVAALLNSTVLDQAFRCISGSVAVSAYELNALPLPPPERLHEVEAAMNEGTEPALMDRLLTEAYLG